MNPVDLVAEVNNSFRNTNSETPSSELTSATKKRRGRAPKANVEPKPIAHLAKVEKFEASLPALSDDAQEVFATLQTLSTVDINVVIAHATAVVRRRSVLASTDAKFEAGQRVVISNHPDTRNIGLSGVVDEVRKIRAWVVTDAGERVYCFLADLQMVASEQSETDDTVAGADEYLTVEDPKPLFIDEVTNVSDEVLEACHAIVDAHIASVVGG
jgi:hypothetical protein